MTRKKSACISCGKPISKEEAGIHKKLLDEDAKAFYCIDCLAAYLEVSAQDIRDKIEEFKEQGCKLFE